MLSPVGVRFQARHGERSLPLVYWTPLVSPSGSVKLEELMGGADDSSPPDSPSFSGPSVVLELEADLKIAADLRLRDISHPAAPVGAPPSDFQPKGSRYQLLGTIGTGGMGTVYLAFDHDLKRRVAMKVLSPSTL